MPHGIKIGPRRFKATNKKTPHLVIEKIEGGIECSTRKTPDNIVIFLCIYFVINKKYYDVFIDKYKIHNRKI